MKQKIKRYTADWMSDFNGDIAITLTTKKDLTQSQAERLFRQYWNKIDSGLYGNVKTRFGRGVERINIIELSKRNKAQECETNQQILNQKTDGRWHLHGIVKTDPLVGDVDFYINYMRRKWKKVMGSGKSTFKPIYEPKGLSNYMCKNIGNDNCDSLLVHSSHINKLATN
jgi:hypothetical protein